MRYGAILTVDRRVCLLSSSTPSVYQRPSYLRTRTRLRRNALFPPTNPSPNYFDRAGRRRGAEKRDTAHLSAGGAAAGLVLQLLGRDHSGVGRGDETHLPALRHALLRFRRGCTRERSRHPRPRSG